MFSSTLRFFLLILCALASIIGAWLNFWPIFVFTIVASFGLLWGYYRSGTVPLALIRLRKEEYKASEKLIDQILKPHLLSKKNKSYFYFINGMLTHENNRPDESNQFLLQALEINKLNEPDKAMALLALADNYLVQNKKDKARTYFEQLKGMKVHPSMMDAVRQMQEWLQV